MSNGTPQYRMADRLTGGRLDAIIAEGRAAGRSYEDIARRLYADHGVEVTRQTLANWAEPAKAAS